MRDEAPAGLSTDRRVATFVTISAAGLLLCWLYAPTTSAVALVACIGTMFAVTRATVAAVVGPGVPKVADR